MHACMSVYFRKYERAFVYSCARLRVFFCSLIERSYLDIYQECMCIEEFVSVFGGPILIFVMYVCVYVFFL